MHIKVFILSNVLFTLVLVTSGQQQVRYTATATTTQPGAQSSPNAFFVFPESRNEPIKWSDSLRTTWLEKDYSKEPYIMKAKPGEYFVFQLGVWAVKSNLSNVKIDFSKLVSTNGPAIHSGLITCFNTGGTSYLGKPFTKKVDVAQGRVQALWMGIDLEKVARGSYTGTAIISANGEAHPIKLQLEIEGPAAEAKGFNEGKNMSRLAWLNNTAGIDDKITKGFLPVTRSGNKINILGRSFEISPNGLPAQVATYFSGSNQTINNTPENIVDKPFQLVIEKESGEMVVLKPGKLEFTSKSPVYISWRVKNFSSECEVTCSGRMEFDGFVDYQLTVRALTPIKIKDIRLEAALTRSHATYMMGLGREGGLRPASWQWKWDTTKHQDALWLGAVNGGLRFKWKAENYRMPLVNIYYGFSPIMLPSSWGNNKVGGVDMKEDKESVMVSAYSGSRALAAGQVLHYDFEMLITPFKTISKDLKYGDRYYHGGGNTAFGKVEKAKETGANILVIHHAEDLYPFINYPYIDENAEQLKDLARKAHAENIRLKLYYTTREITKNIPEFYAFHSLQGEIIYPGPGNASRTEALHPKGPDQWLVKNLRENYIPAWANLVHEGKFKGEMDLSVITSPAGRLNNFYIAGLEWMLTQLKIDGVYIDDSALDRFTLRRSRKLIDAHRPSGRMDMHSWNHFNRWAGFASCLNMYMDLLPYLDLVWIGEDRDYNRLSDHWLVEVSGIPFGLSGQMLQGGGNPWRGMVYGITNRAGWDKKTPDALWKFWDAYNFKDKDLVGYWDPQSIASVDNENIKASVFKGKKQSVIAIANWSKEEQAVSLSINASQLGYDPSQCSITIPFIKDFQDAQDLKSLSQLKIAGGKGYLIVITEK